MRKEKISQYLDRRLAATVGIHSRIASEVGISQASISRIYLKKASPRLNIVEPLLEWFERQDAALEAIIKKPLTGRVVANKRVRRSGGRGAAAGPIG